MAQLLLEPKILRKAWRSFFIRWILWSAVLGFFTKGLFMGTYYWLGKEPQALIHLESLFMAVAWFLASYWAFTEALKEYSTSPEKPPSA